MTLTSSFYSTHLHRWMLHPRWSTPRLLPQTKQQNKLVTEKRHEVKFMMKINNKQTKDQKTPRTDIWDRHEIQMYLDCCLFLTRACHPWGGFNKLQVFTFSRRRSLIRYLVSAVAKPLSPCSFLKSSINCAPLPTTRPWHSFALYLLLAPTEMSQF